MNASYSTASYPTTFIYSHCHGHYRSVRYTCTTCGGTGKVHCYNNQWPNWTIENKCITRTDGTSSEGWNCPCCQICPDCWGLGYICKQEWVYDPYSCICSPCPPSQWGPMPHLPHKPDQIFREGLGVNKKRKCL